MTEKYLCRLAVSGMLLCVLPATQVVAQEDAPPTLGTQPYLFDMGPAEQQRGAPIVSIDPSSAFDESKGYGWIMPPDQSFVRGDLRIPRSERIVDGVSGSEFAFQAMTPKGRWWVTLWIEAGLEDSSSVTITMNGALIHPQWQAFGPPSEPRKALQKIFRVFHQPVDVEGEGLSVQLAATGDLVRLLALSLHPDPVATSPAQKELAGTLSKLGGIDRMEYHRESDLSVFDTIWQAADSLEMAKNQLDELFASDPTDTFSSYWSEQLDILVRAERYFAMRGWERFKKETQQGLFDRLHQVVMLLDGLLDRPDVGDYLLRDRALFTRGRVLYWLAQERGGRHELTEALRDLSDLFSRYPDNDLLAMYNGEQIETKSECDELVYAEHVPDWSRAQREALCRMRRIAHWWTNRQQIANGEFGGKLGDDVELFRWWPPLILSGDTVALAGWQRLADGVWESDETADGYAADVSDVEHSSEFISDTAPFMSLVSDDPEYVDRLRPSGRHFENLWTGISDNGHRFFKSGWFSSSEIEMDPPKNRDVDYNTRATKAVRYLAWSERDPHLIELLKEWSDAWVSAAMRTEKGKPVGILPASVRYPDEAINGDEPTWYIANMYWEYFDWAHSGGSKLLDQLFFTYTLTGDESLMQPLFAGLDLVRKYEQEILAHDPAPVGSAAWAAGVLFRESMFWSVASQWRLHTGDPRYDDLLLRHGPPYLRYRITGGLSDLVSTLEGLHESLRYNEPLRTSEAIHTDRVYLSRGEWPEEFELQAMLTGDGMPEGASPYHAVTWSGGGDGFTALVREADTEKLSADVFVHGAGDPTNVAVDLRVWKLEPGVYTLTLQRGESAPVVSTVEISEPGQRIEVAAARDRLTFIRLQKHD